jgi:hypothetical protein
MRTLRSQKDERFFPNGICRVQSIPLISVKRQHVNHGIASILRNLSKKSWRVDLPLTATNVCLVLANDHRQVATSLYTGSTFFQEAGHADQVSGQQSGHVRAAKTIAVAECI